MTPGQALGAILGVLCVALPLLGVALLLWKVLGWIHTPRVGVALVRTGGISLEERRAPRPGKVSRGEWILVIPRLHKITQVPMCSVTKEWFAHIPNDVSTAKPVEARRLIEITVTVQIPDSDTSIRAAALRMSPHGDVTTNEIERNIPLDVVSRAMLWDYNEDHNKPADFGSAIREELNLSIRELGLQVIDLRVIVTDAGPLPTPTVEPLNDILP